MNVTRPGKSRARPVKNCLVLSLPAAERDELQRRAPRAPSAAPRTSARSPSAPRGGSRCRRAATLREAAGPSAARNRPFSCALPCQMARIVVHRQEAIAARIPFVVIDAVQDAGERGAARAQVRPEPHAVLGRADLARMGRAYRVMASAYRMPWRSALMRPASDPRRPAAPGPPPQAPDRPRASPERSPGSRCCESSAACAPRQAAARTVQAAQQQRRERRVPVVAMQDARRPAHLLAGEQRCAGEAQEA